MSKKSSSKQEQKEQHYETACELFCQNLSKQLVVRSLQLQFGLGKSQAYEAASAGHFRFLALQESGQVDAPGDITLSPQEMLQLAEQKHSDAFLVSDVKAVKEWGTTIQRLKQTYGELQVVVSKDDYVRSMQAESDRVRAQELAHHSDQQQLASLQKSRQIKELRAEVEQLKRDS